MSNNTQPVAKVIQQYLAAVQHDVKRKVDLRQISHYLHLLYEAAGRLDSVANPAQNMYIIQTLLGRAGNTGFNMPQPGAKLHFPHDHHFHLDMGQEWYWIAAHLEVKDENGNEGQLAVLTIIDRTRSVGLSAQQAAGWTDREQTIGSSMATVTVNMPGEQAMYTRSPNIQWPLKDGEFDCSQPGQLSFYARCGPDSIAGPADVLPLRVRVQDGANLELDFTLTYNDHLFASACSSFFLQGSPVPVAQRQDPFCGGQGISGLPMPGLYYSWPQLIAKSGGSVRAGGQTYTILKGRAWIDHQVMMSSLKNPHGCLFPIPFVNTPQPYDGWIWQFYNMTDGQTAFTGAAFITGRMRKKYTMTYGYYIRYNPRLKKWEAAYIHSGKILLQNPGAFTDAAGTTIAVPRQRSYTGIGKNCIDNPLSGIARAWPGVETFELPPLQPCGEFPADYTDNSGQHNNALGFMESIGFWQVKEYTRYALEVLART